MMITLLLPRVLDVLKMLLSGRMFTEVSEVKAKMKAYARLEHSFKSLPAEEEQNSKISVVIPTLNESRYINNPIASLEAGPYRNFEVIIVDCMSDDETVEKAKGLGARAILSKERNAGHQTHLGFKTAKGDIVIRTDADTIFPQTILTKTAKAFQDKQVAVYHVGHQYYDGNILLNLLAHLYDKYWRKIWGTTGHFIAVRKSTYGKVAFRSLSRGQDYDFGKRVYSILGRNAIAYDPNTTVFISSRAVRKVGLLRYILTQGSFRARRDVRQSSTPKV